MRELVIEGRLSVQSQYAQPAEGPGTLAISPTGFMWSIRKLLGGRRDGGQWREVHTFARQSSVLSLAWLSQMSTFDPGSSGLELMAALRFEGREMDIDQVEAAAKANLDARGWRSNQVIEGDTWSAVWAKDWV